MIDFTRTIYLLKNSIVLEENLMSLAIHYFPFHWSDLHFLIQNFVWITPAANKNDRTEMCLLILQPLGYYYYSYLYLFTIAKNCTNKNFKISCIFRKYFYLCPGSRPYPYFIIFVPSFATPVFPEIFLQNTAKVNGPIFFQSTIGLRGVVSGNL